MKKSCHIPVSYQCLIIYAGFLYIKSFSYRTLTQVINCLEFISYPIRFISYTLEILQETADIELCVFILDNFTHKISQNSSV